MCVPMRRFEIEAKILSKWPTLWYEGRDQTPIGCMRSKVIRVGQVGRLIQIPKSW